MTMFLDLFSGIGGFALGAYWAGLRFDKHYFSEIDKYAVQVYQKRFPNAEPLGDIRDVDYTKLPRGEYLVTSGFPCQPHSVAGKQKGSEDERDLWPECARVLRELRPAVALFENVPGLFVSNGGEFFNRVLSDISASGYDCEWQIISAQDAGAPHKRDRVWIVCRDRNADRFHEQTERKICGRKIADSNSEGLQGRHSEVLQECPGEQSIGEGSTYLAYPESAMREIAIGTRTGRNGLTDSGEAVTHAYNSPPSRLRKHGREVYAGNETIRFDGCCSGQWWAVEPAIRELVDGLPAGMDRYEGRVCAQSYQRVNQLRGLGNAVVPQCVQMILSLPAFDRWRIAK